jgi:hypothetical protein
VNLPYCSGYIRYEIFIVIIIIIVIINFTSFHLIFLRIIIEHDNSGFGAAWFLDKVFVESGKGEKWFFPCGKWLATDEDDKKISREIAAVKEDSSTYLPLVKYKITVLTGDRCDIINLRTDDDNDYDNDVDSDVDNDDDSDDDNGDDANYDQILMFQDGEQELTQTSISQFMATKGHLPTQN